MRPRTSRTARTPRTSRTARTSRTSGAASNLGPWLGPPPEGSRDDLRSPQRPMPATEAGDGLTRPTPVPEAMSGIPAPSIPAVPARLSAAVRRRHQQGARAGRAPAGNTTREGPSTDAHGTRGEAFARTGGERRALGRKCGGDDASGGRPVLRRRRPKLARGTSQRNGSTRSEASHEARTSIPQQNETGRAEGSPGPCPAVCCPDVALAPPNGLERGYEIRSPVHPFSSR